MTFRFTFLPRAFNFYTRILTAELIDANHEIESFFFFNISYLIVISGNNFDVSRIDSIFVKSPRFTDYNLFTIFQIVVNYMFNREEFFTWMSLDTRLHFGVVSIFTNYDVMVDRICLISIKYKLNACFREV